MAQSSLDILFERSADVGLTEAIELLTDELRHQYGQRIAEFHNSLQIAEQQARILEIRRDQIANFLTQLSSTYPGISTRPELALCLIHPSYPGEIHELFAYFKPQPNFDIKYFRGTGYPLLHFCIANLMFQKGLVEELGFASSSRAFSFLNRSMFLEKVWVENDFGPPIGMEDAIKSPRAAVDAFYKLIHLLFIFFGYQECENFVEKLIDPVGLFVRFRQQIVEGDAKTLFQEYIQATGSPPPRYEILRDQSTLDHEPVFTVEVRVPRIGLIEAKSRSKKSASIKAAEKAVERLRRDPNTRQAFGRFLRDRFGENEHNKFRYPRHLPDSIRILDDQIFELFCIRADRFRLLQSLISPSITKGKFREHQTNQNLSFMGSKLIDFCLREHADGEDIIGQNPKVVDMLAEILDVNNAQLKLFKRAQEHGVDRIRDIVQAILYSVYSIRPVCPALQIF